MLMRVLHLAAGNRWTGAAAPAFAEVEALRNEGIEAAYAYVGGYKLEAKIGGHAWTHPILDRAQNPLSFRRSVAALRDLMDRERFDLLHAHLTHDHWLAAMAARGRDVRVARTFHSRRVLRGDPLTRALIRRTGPLFVVNRSFRDAPPLAGREAAFTPPPLDLAQFTPAGPTARALHRIEPETMLVTAIGKLSAGRGFETALQTFAILRATTTGARMMIIGHGEHRPALETLAASLGIAADVVWAGYHEDDLAEHYRASDLLLFTARGSDEGHRAVLEAMACGVPAASLPIEGVDALLPADCIAPSPGPDALAALARNLLSRDRNALRQAMAERSVQFGYLAAARRLIAAYEG